MAAVRGGAQRIEFCSNARMGGTTPAPESLRTAREQVRVPIFSMVRPRGGNFFYSGAEFVTMQREVELAKQFGMDGIVLGLLDADGHVDIERTKELVECAQPLPVTFHRAFDECARFARRRSKMSSRLARARLLTSGGKANGSGGAGCAWRVGSNGRRAIDRDAGKRAARREYSGGGCEVGRARVSCGFEFGGERCGKKSRTI